MRFAIDDGVKLRVAVLQRLGDPTTRQDASRYDYWRRMEFTEDQWRGLADHSAEKGVLLIDTPI